LLHHDGCAAIASQQKLGIQLSLAFMNVSSSSMGPGQLQALAGCSQASLAASLAEEKRARRLAEDDALRLYNRIRQLQKEEERADK
jgi:hypothetical protein